MGRDTLGSKCDFIIGELKTRFIALGFSEVDICQTGKNMYNYTVDYTATLRWGVPDAAAEHTARAKRRRTGNVVMECGLCAENAPMSVLCPCGHMMCNSCAAGVDTCPFCRMVVSAKQNAFQP